MLLASEQIRPSQTPGLSSSAVQVRSRPIRHVDFSELDGLWSFLFNNCNFK